MTTNNRWKNRPSGLPLSLYAVDKWLNDQRAWEFLRRDQGYQESYDVAKGFLSKAKATTHPRKAWDFGLSTFVDYILDWHSAQKTLKFRLHGTNYMDPDVRPRIRNSALSFVSYFRINFRLAVHDEHILKRQLRNISDWSKKQLLQHRWEQGLSENQKWHFRKTPKQYAALSRYLRLLDLRAKAGVRNEDIERVLYRKEGEQPLTSKERSDNIHDDGLLAKELTEGGYIKFVIVHLEEKEK